MSRHGRGKGSLKGMTDDFCAAIRAAERKRCEAMLANDGTALADLLDDRLQFHHASGAVDDKAAYLAKIAGGRIRYIAIDWPEERISLLASDVALMTGKMVTNVAVEGVEKRLDNRVMTVWTRKGDDWRLTAFQSTPMAA
jgi:hypothetical protein